MKKDRQATAAAHFMCDRSYIAPDGREILYRDDWTYRKAELWSRCGDRCEEITSSGSRCRSKAAHAHHIVHRRTKGSATRDDRLANLEAVCALHHELKHPEKSSQWTRREVVA